MVCGMKCNAAHPTSAKRERNNFGGSPTKSLLFTIILPNLTQISTQLQLWSTFENLSSVRGLQSLDPYPLRLCLPEVLFYEVLVYENMSRVFIQYKNIAIFVHFDHSKQGKKTNFF